MVRVIDALRLKQDGDELADRLVREVRVRALAKLEHTRDLFPTYTDHTIRHSEGVIRILDWLIPDDIKSALNRWELYFLLAAAYVHDLGMVEGCPGPPEGTDWETFLSRFRADHAGSGLEEQELRRWALQEFVRITHHFRSEQYIRNNAIDLGLTASDTQAEANIIGRISLGHRQVDLSDTTAFGPSPFADCLIRRDLLAAYLRLADELDTTAFRTPLAEYHVLHIQDEKSALEWGKHLSISGVSAHHGVLVVGGECYDHAVFLRLRKLHLELQQKLDQIRRMIRRPYATPDGATFADPIPYHTVEMRIEHINYLPIEVKFDLQDSEIMSLIMGERLYGDQTACIRELLQNAVDTCREARLERPSSWSPKITISVSPNRNQLIVSDNGMGMNEYIVREYFSRVGVSYYRSRDFDGGFRPISQFGIGFLSCFMIADSVEIESKRKGSDALNLTLHSLTDPFVPRRSERNEEGTEVRLTLKQDLDPSIDLIERAEQFARLVDLPIVAKDSAGVERVISQQSLLPTIEQLTETPSEDGTFGEYKQDLTDFLYRLDINQHFMAGEANGIQVGVLLFQDLIAPFKTKSGHGFINMPGLRIYQDGFFVGKLHSAPFISHQLRVVVNLTGDARFPLTADRTRLIGENQDTWREIGELVSQLVEQMYMRNHTKPDSGEWWQFHDGYYSYVDDADEIIVPKALQEATRFHGEFCVFTREGFSRRDLTFVQNLEGRYYWCLYKEHNDLVWLKSLFDENSTMLVVPPHFFPGFTSKAWFGHITGLVQQRDFKRFLEDSGATIEKAVLLERDVSLVDLGRRLGPWGLLLGPLGESADAIGVFDARHPITIELQDSIVTAQSVKLRLLADRLFKENRFWRENDVKFFDLQKELVQELVHIDMLDPELLDTLPIADEDEPHNCPYCVGTALI